MKRVKLRQCYIYVIFHPVYGTPVYVGKGTGNRWLDHTKRSSNIYIKRLVAKYGPNLPIVQIQQDLSAKQAVEHEIVLIKTIGRIKDGGPLFNMTDGGDGVVGLDPKVLRKLGKYRSKRWLNKDWADWMRGRQRLGNRQRIGKPMPPEIGIKISLALKGRPFSEAHKLALRVPKTGRNKVGSKYSQEHAAAISAGVAAYWEKRRRQGLPLTNRTEAGHKKHGDAMRARYARLRQESRTE